MRETSISLRAGSRPSRLALVQTTDALRRIREALGGDMRFETLPIASLGDEDRSTDLRESPPDFFTRELDEALLRDDVDLVVHSAKDLPAALPEGISSFVLPWREDPRDVLVLPAGRRVEDLPSNPVAGVSSQRRAAYCARRFPGATLKGVRGNVEERVAQLDAGNYDVLVLAAAGLIRLGLAERISAWIPLEELRPPPGQGRLAVAYRTADERLARIAERLGRIGAD